MPSPIEEPGFKAEGTDLPKGSIQELDAGMDVAASAEFPEFSDTTDEFDDFALQPTWFPERPITHGLPFGPGANTVAVPPRDEDAVLNDIATETLRTGGSESMRVWSARRLAGE